MHLPDGFIDIPTAAITGAVSAGMVALAVKKATSELTERAVPLLGVTAAFVFAAQMLNFPIAGGTSGHFLGAALVAALLGPYASIIVMTAVLAVQALVMADGGLTALGANVFNMAVVGGLGGYLILTGLRRLLPKTATGYFLAVAVASWFSVVLAAVACSFELAVSGTTPLAVTLPLMTSVHMVIGIGEALITCAVVATVLTSRPDLVHTYHLSRPPLGGKSGSRVGKRGRVWGWVLGALAVSLALVVFVSPFASGAPDGLERVAIDQGFAETAASEPAWGWALLPDYLFPGIDSSRVATAVAGAVGVVALFVLVFLLGRTMGRSREEPPKAQPGEL